MIRGIGPVEGFRVLFRIQRFEATEAAFYRHALRFGRPIPTWEWKSNRLAEMVYVSWHGLEPGAHRARLPLARVQRKRNPNFEAEGRNKSEAWNPKASTWIIRGCAREVRSSSFGFWN